MKRFSLITLFLCLLTYTSAAQFITRDEAKSGSVYSNIGVGVPIDLTGSGADGLGVLGVSFTEPTVPSLANPAQWGNTVFAMATGGISLQNFDASDSQGTSKNTVFAVNNFQLQLPLKENKVGLSLSLAPLTRTNFRAVETDLRITGELLERDTLVAETDNSGEGGINSLEMGLGWKINKNISIGYAGSLVFASMENKISTIFSDVTFQPVNFTLKTSGIGFGNRLGTMLTFRKLFSSNDQLNVGATVSLPVQIASERVQQSDKIASGNNIETVVIDEGEGLGDGDIGLPLNLSGGITYKASSRLFFTAEGLFEQWSDVDYDFEQQQERFLTDRYKTGIGVRYFPFVSGSDKFLSGFKYRMGISYDSGHLTINDRRIETLMLSAGIGIPSPRSNSSIDLSFHYGKRGTEVNGLVKESIWGLRLSINLAELMFRQRKLQ